MLFWVLLSTTAVIAPSLSLPTRTDSFEENEYRLPIYREGNRRAGVRQLDAIEYLPDQDIIWFKLNPSSADGYDTLSKSGNSREETEDTKERILLVRQTTMDPLGGGHLLKRGIYDVHDGHFTERTIEKLGGGHLIGRSIGMLNRLSDVQVGQILGRPGGAHLQKRGFYVDDGHLGERTVEKLGGGHLLGRELYKTGRGNLGLGQPQLQDIRLTFPKRASHLDRLGGGGLLRRETHIDGLGGGHLLRREADDTRNVLEEWLKNN